MVQTGVMGNSAGAVSDVLKEEGLGGLYTGFTSNVAYASPTDAIKFLVSETDMGRTSRDPDSVPRFESCMYTIFSV